MSKKKLVPRLRFREFDDSEKWESYKLSELSEINPRTKLPDNFRYVSLESVKNNFLVSYEITTRIDAPSRAQRLAKKGDVFFQTVRPYQKNNLLFDIIDSNYVFSSGYAQIRTHMNEKFLFYKLMENRFVEKVLARSTGTSYPAIKPDDLTEISILIPSDESEQNKIGSLFKQIDEMIQLQQSKVNKVKDIKSAYLSEMFPKEGEKYPKKRFEGFTEPWKIYNLGEIGYTISGVGFPNSEQGGEKGIMFLKVSDMNLSENTTEIKTSNNFVTAFQVHKRNWKVIEEVPALVFAKVGAALLLDRKRLVNDKFLIDNNMMAYILGEKLLADFTNALFKKIYLPKYAQIGALPSMNDSIVEKIEVLIPSLEEQEKIGKFFKNLDNQISLEEEKLVKLEKLKQAYLNDMFV